MHVDQQKMAEINAALARGEGLRAGATMRKRSEAALHNTKLRLATKKTTQKLADGRLSAGAQYEGWEELRNEGMRIRDKVLASLDDLLRRFAANVEAAGGHVYFAATAQDVVRYVVELAKARNVRKAVKSKSMVSEEVELNPALEAAGVATVETDLGEYIIQLAGVRPSHLITPALHLDRHDVAEQFAAAAGRPLPTDTPTLTAYARARLREEFLTADMGITGCNFAVAESGTVVLVTNEGNGRMVTSAPRIQVTLMGMERLVETWEELDVMLDLLPRSATGQKISTYVSMTTGPRRAGELDGPEELHVVIVDNGRSRLLGSEFQSALRCIRCGACQNVCPVYREIGGHAYGWVYGGPIGAVLTPLYRDWERWHDTANASTLCAACWEACPVRIPLHEMLVAIRRRWVQDEGQPQGKQLPVFTERRKADASSSPSPVAGHEAEPAPPRSAAVEKSVERWLFSGFRLVMTHPGMWRRFMPVGRVAQTPLARGGAISKAPKPIGEWTAGRDLPALPSQSFRELWSSGAVAEATNPAKEERK